MTAKLDKCEGANQKSWGIKEQMIDWRQQKLYAIQEVSNQNETYQQRFQEVNDHKSALRVTLSDLECQLRDL
jgi:hypothetical protein